MEKYINTIYIFYKKIVFSDNTIKNNNILLVHYEIMTYFLELFFDVKIWIIINKIEGIKFILKLQKDDFVVEEYRNTNPTSDEKIILYIEYKR